MNSRLKVSLIIKDHVIRYILYRKNSNELIYHSYGEWFLPSGLISNGKILEWETLSLILEECVKEWKLKGKSVLFTVPDTAVVVRTIEVDDVIPEDEIKGHLFMQLGETLHLPFDEPTFDAKFIGQKNGKNEVLVIASPDEMVKQYQELLSEVKLKPVVADISSLSVYRLLYHLDLSNPSDHLLSLQLSINTMNVAIFHNHIPIFTRHVNLTPDDGEWELIRDSEKQTLSWNGNPEAINSQFDEGISEIERIISFYRFSLTKGKAEVTKIYITGDHPDISLFVDKCREAFQISIQAIQDRELVTQNGQAIPSRFNEIIGLSLK